MQFLAIGTLPAWAAVGGRGRREEGGDVDGGKLIKASQTVRLFQHWSCDLLRVGLNNLDTRSCAQISQWSINNSTCFKFHYHHHADWTPLVFQISDLWVINERIFHTLSAYLQPNASYATLSPDKLVPLNCPIEEDRENEKPGSFLCEMWELVISSTMIHFENWWDIHMELWSDLSLAFAGTHNNGHSLVCYSYFHIVLCLILHWHCYSHRSTDAQEAIRSCHRNFIAFSARLTAIPYFRKAFEEEPDPRSSPTSSPHCRSQRRCWTTNHKGSVTNESRRWQVSSSWWGR